MIIIEIKFLFYFAIFCLNLETSTIWSILFLNGIVLILFYKSTPELYFERLLEFDLALYSKFAGVLS